jgi:hypothetical protein
MQHGEIGALDDQISNVCFCYATDMLTICKEKLLRDQAIAKSTVVYRGIVELACITPPQARIVTRRIVR